MKPRKYINRIEVWKHIEKDDGFGGNITTPSKISDSWCDIKTLNSERLIAFGITDSEYGLRINLRKRNDLDYFDEDIYFVYQDRDYVIQNIVEKDINGYEIEIIAAWRRR